MDKKIIFIVEDSTMFENAAEQAAKNYYGETLYDIVKFKEVEDASSYMRKRMLMPDSDEYGFIVFGFKDADFADVKDRKGESVIKHKGVISPKKNKIRGCKNGRGSSGSE